MDAFTFKVTLPEKPSTRRGVLSIVLAMHSMTPSKLMETSWLTGPEFLRKPESTPQADETFKLSASDPEVCK